MAYGKPSNHSGDWRRALDKVGDLTPARCEYARKLLANKEKYQSLTLSDPAMSILCEKKSAIRDDGDNVAHPNLKIDGLQDLRKIVPSLPDLQKRAGLEVVIEYLISQASKSDKNIK